VLSRLQDEQARYGSFLMKGQIALGLGLVVPLGFVVGAADPIVELFLGEAWAASAPVLALLAVAAGMRTLAFVGYWVYLSRGLTGNLMQFSLVAALVKISLVVIGGYWGLLGVAAGVALAAAIEWPISLWWLSRLTPIPLLGLVGGALRVLLTAVVAAAAGYVGVLLTSGTNLAALWQVLVSGGIAALSVAGLAALHPGVRADVQALRPALRSLRRSPSRRG
jgi:PST family polysaccharide transporter